MTALTLFDAFTTFRAANMPRKKDINVATMPVLIEIRSGLQSSLPIIRTTSCMTATPIIIAFGICLLYDFLPARFLLTVRWCQNSSCQKLPWQCRK